MLQELELKLAAKQSLLPQEPSLDDGNAVTLLVRMPDGSRRGRRFLKSDKLQVELLDRPSLTKHTEAFNSSFFGGYIFNHTFAICCSCFLITLTLERWLSPAPTDW